MRNDEFFVGYLPVPSRLRRFLLASALVVLIGLAATGVTIASRQRDPGNGVWHTDATPGLQGILWESPYPMLETKDRTYLLVNEGKHGATVTGLNGKTVRIEGTILERGELALIELASAPTQSSPDWSLQRPVPPPEPKSLTGEIIDPKCFSGAMKPGDGRTHKGCATLCIRGGIPPVFNDGQHLYLLTDEQGNRLTGETLEQIVPYIADPVNLRGTVEHRKGVRIIRLTPGTLTRWTP